MNELYFQIFFFNFGIIDIKVFIMISDMEMFQVLNSNIFKDSLNIFDFNHL